MEKLTKWYAVALNRPNNVAHAEQFESVGYDAVYKASDVDRLVLRWTAKRPTREGWYWFRFTDKYGKGSDDPTDWCIVQVWKDGERWTSSMNEAGSIADLGAGFTQWAGPIPIPEPVGADG